MAQPTAAATTYVSVSSVSVPVSMPVSVPVSAQSAVTVLAHPASHQQVAAAVSAGQPMPISWQQPQPIVAQGLLPAGSIPQQQPIRVQTGTPPQLPHPHQAVQRVVPPMAPPVSTVQPPAVPSSTTAPASSSVQMAAAAVSATPPATASSSTLATSVSTTLAQQQQPPATKQVEPLELADLARQLDPSLQLDDEVSDLLLELADDFVDAVAHQACQLAKHRGSSVLEAKDVALVVERQYGIEVPGFGAEVGGGGGLRAPRKQLSTEAHRQRLMLIKKAMKKH